MTLFLCLSFYLPLALFLSVSLTQCARVSYQKSVEWSTICNESHNRILCAQKQVFSVIISNIVSCRVMCECVCVFMHLYFYSASLFIVISLDFFRDCFFFPQSIDRTSMLYAACNYVYAGWFGCPIDLFIE